MSSVRNVRTTGATRAIALAALLVAGTASAAGAQAVPNAAAARRAAQNAVAATNAHTAAVTSPTAGTATTPAAGAPTPAPRQAAATQPSQPAAAKGAAATPAKATTTTASKTATPAKGAAAAATPATTTTTAGANAAAPSYAARSKPGAPANAGPGTVSVTERGEEGTLSFQREVFEYGGRGHRDPFVSLIRSGEIRPLFADLKLVTVLYDPTGRNSVAIMHDVSSKDQYRVKVGQTLGRMRVTQIQPKQVVFAIEEFGYGRQAVLALTADTTKARKQ